MNSAEFFLTAKGALTTRFSSSIVPVPVFIPQGMNGIEGGQGSKLPLLQDYEKEYTVQNSGVQAIL